VAAAALMVDPTVAIAVFFVDAGAGAIDPWRVLIALKAMIPETATTWRTKTISNARDNFMFGSDISS
jgi:hypothetical protein